MDHSRATLAVREDGRCLVNTMLPEELISRIFQMGAYDEVHPAVPSPFLISDYFSTGTLEHVPIQFQVLISHVCMHWRKLALGNPLLWAYVSFDPIVPQDRTIAFLQRIQNVPLDIYISTRHRISRRHFFENVAQTNTRLSKFLALTRPYLPQWRSFVVNCHFPSYMKIILHALATYPSAPCLEALKLECNGNRESPRNNSESILSAPFHGDLPNVCTVMLHGIYHPWARTANPLVSELTTLVLSYSLKQVHPTLIELRDILRASPALHHLALRLFTPPRSVFDPFVGAFPAARPPAQPEPVTPLITLDSLTTLVLTSDSSPFLVQFPGRVCMPNVSTVTLSLREDSLAREHAATWERQSVRAILARAVTLEIREKVVDDQLSPEADEVIISEVVSDLQSLRDLRIPAAGVVYDAVRSRLQDCKPPCVSLQRVTFDGPGSTLSVRGLVAERERLGCPLKAVLLQNWDDLYESDIPWFESHLESFEYRVEGDYVYAPHDYI